MGEIYRRSFIRTNRVFMRPIGRAFANVKMIDERGPYSHQVDLGRSFFLSVESSDNFLALT